MRAAGAWLSRAPEYAANLSRPALRPHEKCLTKGTPAFALHLGCLMACANCQSPAWKQLEAWQLHGAMKPDVSP